MKKLNNYIIFRKSLIIQIFFTLFLLFIIPAPVQAQENFPEAIVKESGKIILDVYKSISSDYILDISHLNFENTIVAEEFFSALSDGAVSFTVDFSNQKAILHLKTEMMAKANMDWDVNEWNKYFERKEEGLKHIKR